MALAVYKFSNPYNTDSEKKYFSIKEAFITISQNKDNGIGWTFWDCSYLLADFLEKHYKRDLTRTNVLELGSGCGLISLALCALGCNRIYATDLGKILPNLEHNVTLNKDIVDTNRISIKELEWGNAANCDSIQENIDVLICCECLYEEAPWEKLLQTILYFAERNKELEVVFAYKKRYKSQELFLCEFNKLFVVDYVKKSDFNQEFQKDIDFYEILVAKLK